MLGFYLLGFMLNSTPWLMISTFLGFCFQVGLLSSETSYNTSKGFGSESRGRWAPIDSKKWVTFFCGGSMYKWNDGYLVFLKKINWEVTLLWHGHGFSMSFTWAWAWWTVGFVGDITWYGPIIFIGWIYTNRCIYIYIAYINHIEKIHENLSFISIWVTFFMGDPPGGFTILFALASARFVDAP